MLEPTGRSNSPRVFLGWIPIAIPLRRMFHLTPLYSASVGLIMTLGNLSSYARTIAFCPLSPPSYKATTPREPLAHVDAMGARHLGHARTRFQHQLHNPSLLCYRSPSPTASARWLILRRIHADMLKPTPTYCQWGSQNAYSNSAAECEYYRRFKPGLNVSERQFIYQL